MTSKWKSPGAKKGLAPAGQLETPGDCVLLTQRLAVSVKQFGCQTNGSNGRPERVLKVQTAGLHGVSTLLLLLNSYVAF